jgi:transcriptional regulator with XRE-family HTH domain
MFYNIFLQLCETRGVTPTKALTDMKMDRSAATHWKKQGLMPSHKTLLKIAEYFNVSTDYLMGKKIPALDNENGLSEKDMEFMQILRDLPMDKKVELLAIANILRGKS